MNARQHRQAQKNAQAEREYRENMKQYRAKLAEKLVEKK